MQTMTLNEYGPAARFTPADQPRPEVKEGHVVVRIKATSVNTIDTMIRNMGKDLPLSPDLPALLGMDFAGVVVEVGEGVSALVEGDEVYGCAGRPGRHTGRLGGVYPFGCPPCRKEAEVTRHAPSSGFAFGGYYRLGRA